MISRDSNHDFATDDCDCCGTLPRCGRCRVSVQMDSTLFPSTHVVVAHPTTHESPWHGTAPRILLLTRHCFVAYLGLGRSGADMADSTPEQSFCLKTLAALHLPPPPGMVDTRRRLLLEGYWTSNLRPHRDKIGRDQASGIASVSVLPSCPQSLEGLQPPTHDSQEQEVPHGRNNHDQSKPATSARVTGEVDRGKWVDLPY
ncbi:hypothetical protein CDEST_12241 [Colletotrichum destructivum]|uniref:Uncharacterized protein n=1 Tax=Colletotrichum destructivum TaxID=34406 RepID=A0AAX4IVX0_9PEZI|nr:hypothetical protein CDEST_12241 [Colletotrichum destructivum]